jgi:beta-N-acetylhexosaminidase
MARTMTAAQIEHLAAAVGRQMKAAGVTMDLAPVLDLDGGQGPNAQNADGTRSFGTDPVRTSADGLAFAAGLHAGGVLAVVKHFPGLGSATGNTDSGPAATVAWSTLRTSGLLPFRDAIDAGIPAVMVANATVPGLTTRPASISSVVITKLLRHRLGFTGLVITDSVSAQALGAIGYPVPRAAVAALAAGADMVLFGTGVNDDPQLMNLSVHAIVSAVRSGSLPRSRLTAAVEHVLTAKAVDLCARSAASP